MKKRTWVLLTFCALLGIGSALLFEGDLPRTVVDAKYSNEASRFLTMENGTRVHYRDQGNPDGLAIVLVHGAMASLHTWEPWVDLLGDRYRIVTLDLPAHGLTGAAANDDPSAYGSDAYQRTVSAVTNALNLPRFVLGGNSMGGGVTWRYAIAYPERVLAMILVNAVPADRNWSRTSPASSETQKNSAPVGFAMLRQSWFQAIARYLDPRWLVAQGLQSAYNNSPVVDQGLIDRYYELIMREGTREAILKRSRGAWNSGSTDLSALTQPSLVIWGEKDSVIPVAVAYQFDQHLPETCTVIYDDLGHIPMEEAPQRTAADVVVFLERHFNPPSQSRRPIQTCLE